METFQNVVVNGFTVVPVKYNEQSEVEHFLYVKEHSVRESDDSKPSNRTLFVLNIPPFVSEECLMHLFKECGKVVNVFIHKKPTATTVEPSHSDFFPIAPPVTGYKVAYVVFQNEKSVQKALNLPYSKSRYFSSPGFTLLTGVQKWMKEHENQMKTNEAKLKNEVETYLKKYDDKQELAKEEAKKMDGIADEDGWIKVTRHGRNKAAQRTENQQKKVLARDRKKRKQKELLNFYAFQIRETKREHIAQLRQKFEDDKKRIEQLKQMRRFKPF